ncbi:hypothetical protein PMIN03_012939, partial [Paraphaeosphaeria minitans]
MSQLLPVLFLVAFATGFLLSLWLIFDLVRPIRSNDSDWTLAPSTFDRSLDIYSYSCQACLFAAGLVAVGIQLHNNYRTTWLGFVTLCIIQFHTITMYARVSSLLSLPQWIVRTSYGAVIVSTVAGLYLYI